MKTKRPTEIAELIADSFDWHDTPQGYEYWRDVVLALKDLDRPWGKRANPPIRTLMYGSGHD